MKNYYEEIMEKINESINNNDFEQALKIVGEELSAPYVPQDFEDQLANLEKSLMEKLNFNENNFNNWNTDKVLEIMSKKMDQDIHLMAFDALRGLNARLIIEELKEYLIDKEIKPEYKTFLFMVLIEQGIDQEIVIEKNEKSISLNPSKYKLSEAQDILKDIELKIEQLVYDVNPSLFAICQHIASTYFYYSFPIFNFETYSLNDLAIAIIMKASNSLGIEFDTNLELKLDFNKDNTMLLLNELNNII
ncbi:DUF3196 family protein [Spiroplasma sp. BIUS-1]|uniref:DUF3196 family protein n=1 Tax=Spiroplasma sp. BIUS-1 TaxID=216964 RepID=UPI00139935FE|nr:DUF3196 family protein [Spiroplasma sp. BIUS-1]QHX36531.1 hypothetical protein SBIUS_v1c02780 [Spiroplasma sp. BIUS-1]